MEYRDVEMTICSPKGVPVISIGFKGNAWFTRHSMAKAHTPRGIYGYSLKSRVPIGLGQQLPRLCRSDALGLGKQQMGA
jgi:hypothetical protein